MIGHSKGGAMANIAATRFVAAGLKPYVCTFEARALRRSDVRRRLRRRRC